MHAGGPHSFERLRIQNMYEKVCLSGFAKSDQFFLSFLVLPTFSYRIRILAGGVWEPGLGVKTILSNYSW